MRRNGGAVQGVGGDGVWVEPHDALWGWVVRWTVSITVGALMALGPTSARAQGVLDRLDLPDHLRRDVEAIWDDPATHRFESDARIDEGERLDGHVAVVGGSLTVLGTVDGDVLVVNGDLVFGPRGWVTGDVLVVGGGVPQDVHRNVDGNTTVYRARVRMLTDRRPAARRESEAQRRRRRARERDYVHGGEATVTVRVGPTYNRVEGLPVGFGPLLRSGGSMPFEAEALGIWRTATGLDAERDELGYSVRVEQRLGRRSGAFFGGRLFSVVESIEDWGLSDVEASLATLLLHEDFRDHYETEGWSAYAGVRLPGAGLRFTVDYTDEDHSFRPVADPWTLTDGDDPWRPEPLVAEGNLRSVGADLRMGIPDHGSPYVGGWLLRAHARVGLEGVLERPAHSVGNSPVAARVFDSGDIAHGLIDVRRYNALGPRSRLDLRFIAGGALEEKPLPPQFQHAIGGAGNLPGHRLFGGDCGARSTLASYQVVRDSAASSRAFPNYGCDRFALMQVEYRGDLSFDFGWGDHGRHGNPDDWGDWEDWDRDRRVSGSWLAWSVFFDAGRGWTYGADSPHARRVDTDTLLDAGFGVWLGGLGLLVAVPIDSDDDSWNFFVRLEHRF